MTRVVWIPQSDGTARLATPEQEPRPARRPSRTRKRGTSDPAAEHLLAADDADTEARSARAAGNTAEADDWETIARAHRVTAGKLATHT